MSLQDEIYAIEGRYLGLEEAAIPTETRALNGVIIADGTSSTAAKVMKDFAMKSGANAASGTSYTAANMLEAVGGPETADETCRASVCSSEIDREGSMAPIRTEIRSASAPRLGSTPTKNGMESPDRQNRTTRSSSVPENPFRPKADFDCEIFTDLPPSREESPEHSGNDHRVYQPRKAPIGPIDGNLECRTDAIPDPIDHSCSQVVHQTQMPMQGMAGQIPFANEPVLHHQGGGAQQQHPVVVCGDQVPIDNSRYFPQSTQQNIGSFSGHHHPSRGYHPETHHAVPPMNRRLSTIRNVGTGYVQPVHQDSLSTRLPTAHDIAGRGRGRKQSHNGNGKRNAKSSMYSREHLPSTTAFNRGYDQRKTYQPSKESNHDRHQTYDSKRGPPFDKGRTYGRGRYPEMNAGTRGGMNTHSPPMPTDNGALRETTLSSYTVSMQPHDCLNHQSRRQFYEIPSSINYVACPCDFCWGKDSSVHINGFEAGKLNDPEVSNYVMNQFSKFGEVRAFLPSNRGNSCEIR